MHSCAPLTYVCGHQAERAARCSKAKLGARGARGAHSALGLATAMAAPKPRDKVCGATKAKLTVQMIYAMQLPIQHGVLARACSHPRRRLQGMVVATSRATSRDTSRATIPTTTTGQVASPSRTASQTIAKVDLNWGARR